MFVVENGWNKGGRTGGRKNKMVVSDNESESEGMFFGVAYGYMFVCSTFMASIDLVLDGWIDERMKKRKRKAVLKTKAALNVTNGVRSKKKGKGIVIADVVDNSSEDEDS